MKKLFIIVLLLCGVATWAQDNPAPPATPPSTQPPSTQPPRNPNSRPPNRGGNLNFALFNFLRQPPVHMKATPQGLFILSNGVLAKYNNQKQTPMLVELFDQLPPYPADDAADEEWKAYADAQARRLMPAVIVSQDAELIIACTEQLWLVDAKSLKIKMKALLSKEDISGRPVPSLPAPPRLEVSGPTAYLIRGNQLTIVDLTHGKLIMDGLLPEEMLPAKADDLLNHFMGGRQPGRPGGPGNAPGAPGNRW